MSRTGLLILIGTLIIVIPYSGLPAGVRESIIVALGSIVLAIGVTLRARDVRAAREITEARAPESSPAAMG